MRFKQYLSESAPTIKSIMKIMSTDIAQNSSGWKVSHLDAGDQGGAGKSKNLSVQIEKHLKFPEVEKYLDKKQIAQSHTFAIQAEFSTDSASKLPASATIWLRQGGQIITAGLPSATFKHGDVQSFENAVKKLMKTPDETLVKKLYKSGYHNYGRA